MVSVNEAPGQEAPYGPSFTDGLRVLSANAQVPFTQYTRYVLPLDGYVFWLRTQTTTLNGSLHVVSRNRQEEDETFAMSRVVFSTTTEVQFLTSIAPNTLWIGEAQGLKFAFSESGPTFRPSGAYHYLGDAVYPALLSQLVDVGSQLSPDTLVVSNSLPAWLTLLTYDPPWLSAPNPKVTLYPSFLVPGNIAPPYGAVHVYPDRTEAIQASPTIGPLNNHYQLVRDRVRVTLYGMTNDQAVAFLDLVGQFALSEGVMGLMNSPVVRDERRTQVELGVIAMKKTIEFEVNYYQTSIRNIAEKFIKHVAVNYLVDANSWQSDLAP